MSPVRWRALLALGLFLLSFVGAAAWKPRVHMAETRHKIDLVTLFPKEFGEWVLDQRMPVQLVSPDQEAMLKAIYNQTLSRTYVNQQGERIMLSVAYGGDQSDATRAHRPEACYPAQGFQIVSSATGTLQIAGSFIPVRKLVARAGSRNEPITYWVITGDFISTSGTEQKLTQLRYTMRGVVPDGMLVRISSIGTDPSSAFKLHGRFIDQMARSMGNSELRRVFGVSFASS